MCTALSLLAATPVYRINCGGGAVGDFAADSYFNGGSAYASAATVDTSGVQNPPPAEVYNSVRALYQGNFSYTFPGLTSGAPYSVRLHFADSFSSQPGTRLFNVVINGAAVLTDFDVIATAGGPSIAIAREFTVPASGAGEIVIAFNYVVDSAIPAAIEIWTSDSTAPTVTLSSPADNATFNLPSNINLEATAASSSGTITKVDFYQGTTLLNSDSTSPYAFSWSNTNVGSYTFTAVATDNHGLSTTSPPVRVKVVGPGSPVYQINCGGTIVENFAPDDFFTGGSAYTSGVDVDISNVPNPPPLEVYKSVRASASSSFGYVFPSLVAGGNYTLRLHFADIFSGDVGQRIFNIDINQSRVLTNFDIIAAAGGPGIAVAREFSVSADAAGNIAVLFGNVIDSAIPAAIEVLVAPAGLPSAQLTQPADGSVFRAGSTVTIEAVASDTDGTITKVEFFADETRLGEATQAPYRYLWASPAAGTHVLTAKATDNAGNSTVAASALVTINEAGRAYQINCGGSAVGPFGGDAYYIGGQAFVKDAVVDTSAVANPPPPGVYTSVRALYQGSFSYVFPGLIAGGDYTVRLHFADNFSSSPGDRVFNVVINEQPVLTDFDIIAAAGGPNIALARDFLVKGDSSGQITIAFSYVVDSAIPAGIEILGEPAPVNPPRLSIEKSGGGVVLSWDDPGYVLQESNGLGQTWTTITGATSPHPLSTTGAGRFFRLSK